MAADRHTLAIKTDGTLWAWGWNQYGQLGDGTNITKISPVKIGTANNWANISGGAFHSVAIKTDGTLWAWGANAYGQLGDGTTSDKNIPVQIGNANNWAVVSAYSNHTLAIKTDGTLWGWGDNSWGVLGDGTTINRNTPVQIGTANNWAMVSEGYVHSVALKTDGTIWAWGNNYNGQLGDGTLNNSSSPKQIGIGNNWTKIVAGGLFTLALKNDSTLWGWGDNTYGQLGDGTTTNKTNPMPISTVTKWTAISAGYSHSIAIKADASLWTWGRNSDGQLGDGTTTQKNIPTQISSTINWTNISGGTFQTLAIKINNSFWAWGYNGDGQLGDSTTQQKTVPIKINVNGCVTCIPTSSITNTTACDKYTWYGQTYTTTGTYVLHLTNVGGCDSVMTLNLTIKQSTASTTDTAITSSQLPFLWNGNSYNSAGVYTVYLTNAVGCDSVVMLNLSIKLGCFKQVSAGSNYSIAIKIDGSLWAWGFNGSGQLGDGTNVSRYDPVKIGTDTNWALVSAGDNHSVAIKTDGSLWAWGANDLGQVGDSTAIYRKSPVRIGTLNNWSIISAGTNFTIAIRIDGTLWAWGKNDYNQLGDGTNIDKNTPTQIGTANNWSIVSAGYAHSIALKKNGTLWSWGRNISGQLGDGSTIDKTIPIQIGTATNWSKLSAGYFHSLAIKTNGSLWAWGSNYYGQLGDGTTTQRNSPLQIGTAIDWTTVDGGNGYSTAIKTNNSLWAWGNNSYGNLGDSSQISKSSPVKIGSKTTWKSICAGYFHTMAIRNDGSLWAWGSNTYGGLGDGTGAQKISPIQLIGTGGCISCTSTTSTITQSACGSYIWNGITYTQSGSYTKTGLTNMAGCDSIATLNLTINPDFSGNITHPTKGNINNVGINYNGTTSNFTGGKYNYDCITAGTNLRVKPTKNNDITKANGINATDVLFTQRHILNTTKLNSAYKLIAADVNGDKLINATDVLRIKRLILGTDTTFTSATKGNRLWEFVDSAYIFPDTTNPFPFKDSISFTNLTSNKINQTFIGVKLGDVNYDWNPLVAKGSLIDNVELIIDNADIKVDKQLSTVNYQLPIKVKNFKDLVAMQYTLHFDHTKYEFVGIENNHLNIDFNSKQASENGNITMLWTDKNAIERSLEDGTELFVLVLQSTVDRRLSTDLELALTNDITEVAAWDKELNQHNIILTKQQKLQTPNPEQWSVSPNPTSGDIKVNIVSKVNKAVSFELTDAQGKTILKQVVELQKGNNNFTVNLKKNGNLTSGIYFLKAVGVVGDNIRRIIVK